MAIRDVSGFNRGILLPVFLVVVLLFTGCSGDKSNPITSDEGPSRLAPWTINGEDEGISDTAGDEQNVDITNVVYGYSWGGERGLIKMADFPPGDPYTYTVATWQQPNGDVSDVYFRVLYREGPDPMEHDWMGDSVQVDGGYASEVQIQPAITAHLNENQEIVVDLVFMSRPWFEETPNPYNWRIIHTRYRQDSFGDFNGFSCVSSEDITPFHVFHNNCAQPDIVFDAGAESPDGWNRLHVVFVIMWEFYDRDVWYERGDVDGYGFVIWHTREFDVNFNHPGVNAWPRIDVGFDASGWVHSIPQGTPGTQTYYVGIVWQYSWYDFIHDTWPTNVVYAQIPANEPLIYWMWSGDIVWGYSIGMMKPFHTHHMALPCIDIEPIVCTEDNRTTMIVWTHAAQYEGENDYDAANVEATNTLRLYMGYNEVDLFYLQGPGNLNGVATFAAKADDSNSGYLTWLNCNGLNYNGHVYAGEVFWEADPEYFIWSDNTWFNISSGHSSVAPDTEYRYGPEVAIFNENVGKCIWTDIANGSPPSIWGDSSDWFD
jgi:hypothetical protein